MDLKQFDGKRILLTDREDRKYEGIGEWQSAEYCEHEYGVFEECLNLCCFVFYSSNISDVKRIEEYTGPYGNLEKEAAETGIELIEEFLLCEEEEYVLRMMAFLKTVMYAENRNKPRWYNDTAAILRQLRDTVPSERIMLEAGEMLKACGC